MKKQHFPYRRTCLGSFFLLFSTALLATSLLAESSSEAYHLRVYGDLSVENLTNGHDSALRIHAQDNEHAKIVYSKLLGDFTSLPTVKAVPVSLGESKLTLLAMEGGRRLLPVLKEKSDDVDVYLFETPEAWDAFQKSGGPAVKGATASAKRAHPLYMDLWDKRNMGFWYSLGFKALTHDRTDDQDFDYMRPLQLNVNSVGPTGLAISLRCDRDDIGFKMNRWFNVSNFIYNSLPEVATKGDPDMTINPSYYGDVPLADNPIKSAQTNEMLLYLSQVAGNEKLMAITDPYGEIAAHSESYYDGFQGRDEYSRKDLIHYLRDIRKLSLQEVGERWYGKPDTFKSWDAVQFPRERDFYGWQDGKSQDLGGIWKLRLAKREDGESEKVFDPAYDDSKWLAYRQPGTQYLTDNGLEQTKIPVWLRTSFTPDPALLKSGAPIYLSVCPLAHSPYKNPCTVYLNGEKIADLTFGYGREWGQIDISKQLKPGVNNLTVYVWSGIIQGPVFLTLNKAEVAYPCSNPQLNARRYDLHEWVADVSVRALADSFKDVRGIDPNRGIKLMAPHDIIDVALSSLAKWGVYSHCTGEGAFFRPVEPRNAYLHGIVTSAESAASANNLNELKKFLFCFTFEGTGIFDYFYNLHDILIHQDKKDWYDKNVDYYKLAGRFNLKKPDVAFAYSLRNDRFGVENGSHSQNNPGRGDIQQAHYGFVYCSEKDIAEGLAAPYKVIIDDNLSVVDEKELDALEAWVKKGGTLVLNQRSGRDTYLHPASWPIQKLTGCAPSIRPQDGTLTFEKAPSILKSYAGTTVPNYGEVVDWQKHNYFTDSVALEPKAEGIEVIARYQDGKPAIVVRSLGAGKVIVLGSSFYRKSSDIKGFYIGSPAQTDFYKSLLGDLGIPSLVESETESLWAERFVANNGTTEMLVLGNQSDINTIPQASAVWDLGYAPRRVFDPVTGADLPAKIEGNRVNIDIRNLPPFEMRYYAVERTDLPVAQTVKTWLHRQTEMWRALPKVEKPLLKQDTESAKYLYNKYVVKQFENEADARKAMEVTATPGNDWSPTLPADWASAGLKTGSNLWAVYRKPFELDAAWLKDLRRVELAITDSRSSLSHVDEIQINGLPIRQKGMRINDDKLLSVLKPGKNLLTLLSNAGKDGNGGFSADMVLLRIPGGQGQTILPLNSDWTAYPTSTDPQSISLPRSGNWLMVRKSVDIPEKFKSCQVWIEMEGAGLIVSTNGRSRYDSNVFGAEVQSQPTLVNITPDIQFGKPNEIVIAGSYSALKPKSIDLKDVKLIFIPVNSK